MNRQVGGYAKAKVKSNAPKPAAGSMEDDIKQINTMPAIPQDTLDSFTKPTRPKLTPAKLTPARLIKREFQNRVSGESYIPEEGYDRMRDRRLELYGTGHDGSDRRGSSGGSRKPQTKKERKESQKRSEQAYKNVVQSLKDKYGDNAVITSSRKKKAKKDK